MLEALYVCLTGTFVLSGAVKFSSLDQRENDACGTSWTDDFGGSLFTAPSVCVVLQFLYFIEGCVSKVTQTSVK